MRYGGLPNGTYGGVGLLLSAEIIVGGSSTLSIYTPGLTNLLFGTNSTTRWVIEGATNAGHLLPNANNTYDIGSSSFAPRTVYAATSFAVADATAARTSAKNLAVPYILSKSAIPFIHLSSGSMNNNGAFVGVTNTPLVAGMKGYALFPAGAVAAGVPAAAALLWTEMATTSTGTVYNNTYSSGTPAFQSSPTAFATTGPGAWTGSTTSTAFQAISVPANALGANGGMTMFTQIAATNNANAKSFTIRYGGSAISGAASTVSALTFDFLYSMLNRGVTNSQLGSVNSASGLGASSAAHVTTAIDSTSAQTMDIFVSKSTATDNVVVDSYVFNILSDGT